MSKPDQSDDPLILVAAIAGAFGVRGEVKLKSFTAEPDACLSYGPLLDAKGAAVLTIIKSRTVKNALAVTAKQVTTREQAEAMKSTKLYVPRSRLPQPEEDEFYLTDLVGLSVEMRDGSPRGRIKAVHDFGAGDLLEIQSPGEKDWLLPFTKLAVPVVDITGGKVVIDPPEEIEGDEDRDT